MKALHVVDGRALLAALGPSQLGRDVIVLRVLQEERGMGRRAGNGSLPVTPGGADKHPEGKALLASLPTLRRPKSGARLGCNMRYPMTRLKRTLTSSSSLM